MTDRAPTPCLHPNARHVHGTRAAYVRDGCRCPDCTQANREYEDQRHRNATYGRTALVDAEPVRAHLAALTGAGYGYKRIARLAGISHGVTYNLLYATPPSRRVRPAAAAALLALTLAPPAPPKPAQAPRRPPRPSLPAPRNDQPPPSWDGVRLDDLDPDMPWQSAALCAQTEPDLWFPGKGVNSDSIKRVCMRCPVREPCLDAGVRSGDQYGIYGGLTYRQRLRHPGYKAARAALQAHRVAVVAARHATGWTDEAIAAELDIAPVTVYRIRRQNCVGPTPRKALSA